MNNTRDAQHYRCSQCGHAMSFAAGTYTRHVAVTMLRADGWWFSLGEAKCPKHAPAFAAKQTPLELALRASLADLAMKRASGSGGINARLRVVRDNGDHERDTAGGSMAATARRFAR